jgi:hypothetical protein
MIVGSLLWDDTNGGQRADWREARLGQGAAIRVATPIRYGRKSSSRADTFTMIFSPGDPVGEAVILPCRCDIATLDDLIVETQALWQAEARAKDPGPISDGWGCIGAMFSSAATLLSEEWSAHFRRCGARQVSVVNAEGILEIDWPARLDGGAADFDLILATATKPAKALPSAEDVADAWIERGSEGYFFNNVKHGIRTAGDGDIWKRIKERDPAWLRNKAHAEAIGLLNAEAAS